MSDGSLDLRKRRGGVLTSSEKITGAKNAQADMILQRLLQQFQQDLRKLTTGQQADSYHVEHELKLLSLDRKCSELDEQKRLYPEADHSHEESTIRNLSKYLVQTTGVTSYTDKKLTHKIRTLAQPDSKTPVVAKAQATLRQQSYERALRNELEAAAKVAADQDGGDKQSDPRKRKGEDPTRANVDSADDDDDDSVFKQRGRHSKIAAPQVRRVSKTAANSSRPDVEPNHELIPGQTRRNISTAPQLHTTADNRKKVTTAEVNVVQNDATGGTVVRPPLTQAAMRECLHRVNKQVISFCEYVDTKVWERKEEDFQQALKYVKDKEVAWAAFMEDMQKRQRVKLARFEEMQAEEALATEERERQLGSGATAPVRRHSHDQLSASQKKKLLLENILPTAALAVYGIERRAASSDSLLPGRLRENRQRGIPWHTAARSNKHSPSMKLKMILDRARATGGALKDPEPTVAAVKVGSN